jgi:hypothetical protein
LKAVVPLDADLVLLTARLTVRLKRNRSPLQSAELPGLEGPTFSFGSYRIFSFCYHSVGIARLQQYDKHS